MRTCIRKGCGNDLLDKTGAPSYRKIFCSRECSKLDNLEKKRKLRTPKPGGKCRLCGKRTEKASSDSGVSADTGFERVIGNAAVLLTGNEKHMLVGGPE